MGEMPGTDEAGAANVNGGGSLAACAAALSDDVLELATVCYVLRAGRKSWPNAGQY